MTECVEQRYCIKFYQKLGDRQAETIRTFGTTGLRMVAHRWKAMSAPEGRPQHAVMMLSWKK